MTIQSSIQSTESGILQDLYSLYLYEVDLQQTQVAVERSGTWLPQDHCVRKFVISENMPADIFRLSADRQFATDNPVVCTRVRHARGSLVG